MIWEFDHDLIELVREVVVRLNEFRGWLALENAALNSRGYGSEGTLKLETSGRIASIFRSSKLVLPGQQFKADGQHASRAVSHIARQRQIHQLWHIIRELVGLAVAR